MKKEGIMNGLLKTTFIFIAIVTLMVATGCAKPKVRQSGFLGEYPPFQQGPKGGADRVYSREGVDFTVYKKIMMDQVVFYLKKDTKHHGVNPDSLEKLADEFHMAMADALKGSYPIVDKPGADVLRIRFAVTNIVPSQILMRPTGSSLSAGVSTFVSVGDASIEAELLDSLTNKRIGAAMDRRIGTETQSTAAMDEWKDIKEAFRFWAQRLLTWLDETHGRK
jgi:hypothetical protein